jgi:hypothetical protein
MVSRALGPLAVMQQSGVVPDIIIYSAAVNACEKGTQWQRALGPLAMMQQSGLMPSVIAYSAAVSACLQRLTKCSH